MTAGSSEIRSILELARWAPSGDNTQPWRFEIVSDREILVHGYDTRDSCVYDLDGCASQLSHGALLETLSLAATRFGLRARVAPVDAKSERELLTGFKIEQYLKNFGVDFFGRALGAKVLSA